MESGQKPIVVVGSLNIDLVVHAPRIPLAGETIGGDGFQTHPGGKGANQAVAVGRLGYPVQMIGRVGKDAFGNQLRQNLAESGVDVSSVMTSEGSSGVAVIVVAANGDNSIVVVPGANALLCPADLDAKIDAIRGAGIVLTQLEVPTETVLHLARLCGREGVPLMLDPAPARELPNELLQAVEWFTPNETEAAFFAGAVSAGASPAAIAQVLRERGVRGIVLKMGERGVYLANFKNNAEGDPGFATDSVAAHAVAAFRVRAVDTTAAGDAFNGAFATALMLGKHAMESADFAAAAAAISVTRAGAQPSMPNRAEVEVLLHASGEARHKTIVAG